MKNKLIKLYFFVNGVALVAGLVSELIVICFAVIHIAINIREIKKYITVNAIIIYFMIAILMVGGVFSGDWDSLYIWSRYLLIAPLIFTYFMMVIKSGELNKYIAGVNIAVIISGVIIGKTLLNLANGVENDSLVVNVVGSNNRVGLGSINDFGFLVASVFLLNMIQGVGKSWIISYVMRICDVILVVLTGSRAAVLMIGFMLFSNLSIKRLIILVLIILLPLIFIINENIINVVLEHRIMQMAFDDPERMYHMQLMIRSIGENYIIGAGFGKLGEINGLEYEPHGAFLLLAAEGGLPAILGLIILNTILLVKIKRKNKMTGVIIFIGWIIALNSVTHIYQYIFFIIPAILTQVRLANKF